MLCSSCQKIKKLQFDAASEMLTMCLLHVHVHTHTHRAWQSGYVMLSINTEFSISGEANIQASELVLVD